MDCSLSEGASRYLDVLYDEYEGFDVHQTTVGVNPEEFAALEEHPSGAAVRVRMEGEEGVLMAFDGDEWQLPGAVVDDDPDRETVVDLVERRTGVSCEIDGLDRVSIVCLQCDVIDDEIWTLSAIFTATALGGTPRTGVAWREPSPKATPALSIS